MKLATKLSSSMNKDRFAIVAANPHFPKIFCSNCCEVAESYSTVLSNLIESFLLWDKIGLGIGIACIDNYRKGLGGSFKGTSVRENSG